MKIEVHLSYEQQMRVLQSNWYRGLFKNSPLARMPSACARTSVAIGEMYLPGHEEIVVVKDQGHPMIEDEFLAWMDKMELRFGYYSESPGGKKSMEIIEKDRHA